MWSKYIAKYVGLGLGKFLGGNVLQLANQALTSTLCYRYNQEEIRRLAEGIALFYVAI